MRTQTLEVLDRSDASSSSATAGSNSISRLSERASAGSLGWAGPLTLLVGRSALMIAAQAIASCLIWLQSHIWLWNAAAKWWTVYGTLVDIGCLALMTAYTRKERIRLRDLIGHVRLRWGRDLLLGIGCLLLIFPVFAVAFPAASRLVYGTGQPAMYPGLLSARILPFWGVIYSLSVFWLIWSTTEEMTYNGYALPRLEALCGNRWIALAIVGLWWALQHSFIPFVWERKYVVYRFISFLPGVIVFGLIYLRLRRLPPLVVAHWTMDISAILYTLQF